MCASKSKRSPVSAKRGKSARSTSESVGAAREEGAKLPFKTRGRRGSERQKRRNHPWSPHRGAARRAFFYWYTVRGKDTKATRKSAERRFEHAERRTFETAALFLESRRTVRTLSRAVPSRLVSRGPHRDPEAGTSVSGVRFYDCSQIISLH